MFLREWEKRLGKRSTEYGSVRTISSILSDPLLTQSYALPYAMLLLLSKVLSNILSKECIENCEKILKSQVYREWVCVCTSGKVRVAQPLEPRQTKITRTYTTHPIL